MIIRYIFFFPLFICIVLWENYVRSFRVDVCKRKIECTFLKSSSDSSKNVGKVIKISSSFAASFLIWVTGINAEDRIVFSKSPLGIEFYDYRKGEGISPNFGDKVFMQSDHQERYLLYIKFR